MMRAALILVAGAALAAGCHKEDGHAHPHGAKAPAPPERPTLSVTVYQSGLELFMEYPALVVGQPSPLIAHFTDARNPNGFKPLEQGTVTSVLRYEDGSEHRFVADTLLRTGIFKPVVTPPKAGKATLTLTLEGPQAQGTVEAGPVMVYADEPTALREVQEPEGTEATVGFLKEQQWKTEYATVPAVSRVLEGGVRANGELQPVAGQAAEISAPVAGRIASADTVPSIGMQVKKGGLLVRLQPTGSVATTDAASIELEVQRARAELELARKEEARAGELLAARAIPEKQVDAAKTQVRLGEARLQAAEQQRALFSSVQSGSANTGRTFDLRSPIDGVVAFARVTPGAVVEAGARLLSVVNTERLWLQANVYEMDAAKVHNASGASFEVAGIDQELVVDATNGRRVAIGAVVDPLTRTVPVIFELARPDPRLKPGMFAKVTVFTGETLRGVAIPESAIVDESGKPTVFVLEGGESFFKRQVKLGIRSRGFAQVLSGVKEGERVVSRGAYDIRLATASGAIPEHGHQH